MWYTITCGNVSKKSKFQYQGIDIEIITDMYEYMGKSACVYFLALSADTVMEMDTGANLKELE